MKIAIDSWTLNSRFRCQGTYVYARHLLDELKRMAGAEPAVSFTLFASARNGNDAVLIPPAKGFECCPARLLDHDRLWRMAGASLAALRIKADVIFAPTVAMLPLGAVPVVCTIHDVTPVTMPSHSGRVTASQRALMWSAAKFSRAVITDSECSRRDIIEIFGLRPEKVSVVALGYDAKLFNDQPPDGAARDVLKTRLGLHKPYILHHGTIQPRKNLKRLIQAYRLMLSRNHDLDFDLVLAGQPGWASEEILAAASNSAGAGRVILTGLLPDKELSIVVKCASLAVCPSLYEGFCLPMVEAMACGVPTIAANSSCLPEISGNALAYFDPQSVEDMALCIDAALTDSDLQRRLCARGRERARAYCWKRCARETLAILTRAGAGRE